MIKIRRRVDLRSPGFGVPHPGGLQSSLFAALEAFVHSYGWAKAGRFARSDLRASTACPIQQDIRSIHVLHLIGGPGWLYLAHGSPRPPAVSSTFGGAVVVGV